MKPITNFQLTTPVLLLVFNRLETTRQVFEAIRQAKPPRLYIGADGARVSMPGENEKVMTVRDYIIENIDWDCEVRTLFRDRNLGCKRAVSEAISWFFDNEVEGIILEDDCLPTNTFFEFCEWGLKKYQGNDAVGMISGSNLLDYLSNSPFRNVFSRYISIWGWGTWRDRWSKYDSCISLNDIKDLDFSLRRQRHLSYWERFFWRNVFKHTVTFGTTWDFYVQFMFFRENLFNVFPTKNLVTNLGFGQEATHTKIGAPEYWKRSLPQYYDNLMSLPASDLFLPDVARDRILAATIYNCKPLRAIRLAFMNVIRYTSV